MSGFKEQSKFKEFVQKYRNVVIACLIGLLLVFTAGAGFMYGKSNICKKSGGVLAVVPGQGEACVQNFIDVRDCRQPLSGRDLVLTAHFCRDATGLYPVGVFDLP